VRALVLIAALLLAASVARGQTVIRMATPEARATRDQIVDKRVPRELLDRVLSLLADGRGEHRESESN
jgi:hypothetical protein